MVVGEKHRHTDEGPIRSARRGTRSPHAGSGATPSGTSSPSVNTGGGSSSSDEENGMRAGAEYQASIPDCNPGHRPVEAKSEGNYAILVWAPHLESQSAKVDEYISIAQKKYGYNIEQALGMLFWHRHNVDRALADLANFTPFPDEWSVEDRVLFEQAFLFHGKNFHRIHLMLPDKSVASLVKHYYSWKKCRSRTSLLDKKSGGGATASESCDEDLKGGAGMECDADEAGSGAHSLKDAGHKGRSGGPVSILTTSVGGGSLPSGVKVRGGIIVRPPEASGSSARVPAGGPGGQRNRAKAPRGLDLDLERLREMAVDEPGSGAGAGRRTEMELIALKTQVQTNKQTVFSLKQKVKGIDAFRPAAENGASQLNLKWTQAELMLAVQGVRAYGKDFEAIAELIGTKTNYHVRCFFLNYNQIFNLDEVVRDWEGEQRQRGGTGGNSDPSKDEGPMDLDAIERPENGKEREGVREATLPPPLLRQILPGAPASLSSNKRPASASSLPGGPPVKSSAAPSLVGLSVGVHQAPPPPPLYRPAASLHSPGARGTLPYHSAIRP